MCVAGSAAPCPATLPKGATYQLIYTKTGARINFGRTRLEATNSATDHTTSQHNVTGRRIGTERRHLLAP